MAVRRIRELCLGLGLIGVGTIAMQQAATSWSSLLQSATALRVASTEHASGGSRAGSAIPSPEPAPAAANAPAQTLKESEPPSVIGPAFDSDPALPSEAIQVVSYELSARLDALAHTIDGRGSISWTNRSQRPVTEIWLHLYLNAFKNSRTVFLRSPFQRARSGLRPTQWGYIDVHFLKLRSGRDIWKDRAASSPGQPDDETDIRVPLPEPIEPGETLVLEMEWTSQLPSIVERTGFEGGFHMVAQWFPKLARLEPNGTWAHFAFHPHSEFYADYGRYDVTLDVPKEAVVGATGQRVAETFDAGRKRIRYQAASVHDFAWTAWNDFRTLEATRQGVSVRLLYPAGHRRNAERTLDAIDHGLAFYGRAFGRYPYPSLTAVHPPVSAGAAGGMEYPTLITTGGPWYAGWTTSLVERVTLHELGHQWFYGLLATNEHSWPFLDEGLTTYAEMLSMHALLGQRSAVDLLGLQISDLAYIRTLAAQGSHNGVVALPAADFASFRDIGRLVYSRTGTILWTLGSVYGHEQLKQAVGRYARRYRFQHPQPKHLIAAIREVMGDEAAQILHTALFDNGWVDYVAGDVRSARAARATGIFDHPSGRETVTTRAENPDRWIGQALVYRHGSLVFPVEVDLIAENGTRTRRQWDGRGRWKAFEYEGKAPLARIEIDPSCRIALDQNLLNNAASESRGQSGRVTERAVYWTQLLLSAVGP